MNYHLNTPKNIKRLLPIFGTLLIASLLFIYFSTQIPFTQDEFWLHSLLTNFSRQNNPHACSLKILNHYELPLRTLPYAGIIQNIIYWPLWKIWPSPYSLRLLGFIALFLQALLIRKLFKYPLPLVFLLLLAFAPYTFQHIVDAGGVVFLQTTFIFIICLLVAQWRSKSAHPRALYIPMLIGLIVFLGIWSKLTFVALIPGILIVILSLSFPSIKNYTHIPIRKNNLMFYIILSLTALIPSYLLLSATDMLPWTYGACYYEQLHAKSIIPYYKINLPTAQKELNQKTKVIYQNSDLREYIQKQLSETHPLGRINLYILFNHKLLQSSLYQCNLQAISLNYKESLLIQKARKNTSNNNIHRQANYIIIKKLFPKTFAEVLVPWNNDYWQHFSEFKQYLLYPITTGHLIYQPSPKNNYLIIQFLYSTALVLILIYALVTKSLFKGNTLVYLSAFFITLFILSLSPATFAMHHLVLSFPFAILACCEMLTPANMQKAKIILSAFVITFILFGITTYYTLSQQAPYEYTIPANFKIIYALSALSKTHVIYATNWGLYYSLVNYTSTPVTIGERGSSNDFNPEEYSQIKNEINTLLRRHPKKLLLAGYTNGLSQLAKQYPQLQEINLDCPQGAWRFYSEP